jgi:hypothetical protein
VFVAGLLLATTCEPQSQTAVPAAPADAATSAPALSSAAPSAAPAAAGSAFSYADVEGDGAADVEADTEYACRRTSDGRAGQWSQIGGFHTKTWKSLVLRVDQGRGAYNADADRARHELEARIAARCKAHRDSFCCPDGGGTWR